MSPRISLGSEIAFLGEGVGGRCGEKYLPIRSGIQGARPRSGRSKGDFGSSGRRGIAGSELDGAGLSKVGRGGSGGTYSQGCEAARSYFFFIAACHSQPFRVEGLTGRK